MEAALRPPKRSHLELTSGRYLDFYNPRPEDISLDDISLALSNSCRWGGHCEPFYSIAEHACLVHDIVKAWGLPEIVQFAALHHDDHEAYVGDVPTPLKNVLGESFYRVADRLDNVIAFALDCDPTDFHHAAVKEADTLALFVEAERFKPSGGAHWDGRPDVVELPAGVLWVCGNSPQLARNRYLDRHWLLEAKKEGAF